jgi:hypothetical protein
MWDNIFEVLKNDKRPGFNALFFPISILVVLSTATDSHALDNLDFKIRTPSTHVQTAFGQFEIRPDNIAPLSIGSTIQNPHNMTVEPTATSSLPGQQETNMAVNGLEQPSYNQLSGESSWYFTLLQQRDSIDRLGYQQSYAALMNQSAYSAFSELGQMQDYMLDYQNMMDSFLQNSEFMRNIEFQNQQMMESFQRGNDIMARFEFETQLNMMSMQQNYNSYYSSPYDGFESRQYMNQMYNQAINAIYNTGYNWVSFGTGLAFMSAGGFNYTAGLANAITLVYTRYSPNPFWH